jgi:hypothetical protein
MLNRRFLPLPRSHSLTPPTKSDTGAGALELE